jgi:hypothetical protein
MKVREKKMAALVASLENGRDIKDIGPMSFYGKAIEVTEGPNGDSGVLIFVPNVELEPENFTYDDKAN